MSARLSKDDRGNVHFIMPVKEGQWLEATFLPGMGMNLISYKKGELEVIDQSTRSLFEERFAGLGALMGPHFHRRRPEILPKIPDESLFPHIARVKQKGNIDPFSHGIARYAPWKVLESSRTKIRAIITGKDVWNGVPLSMLEGQPFVMKIDAELSELGLTIDLSVVGESDTIVGIHYYYNLPQGKGHVISSVKPDYLVNGVSSPIPKSRGYDDQNKLSFDLAQEADFTFHPFPNPRSGTIILDAIDYKLQTTYASPSQENSWQLYHPAGASFVCIEPLSAQDPRHPNLSVSSLNIRLEIT